MSQERDNRGIEQVSVNEKKERGKAGQGDIDGKDQERMVSPFFGSTICTIKSII